LKDLVTTTFPDEILKLSLKLLSEICPMSKVVTFRYTNLSRAILYELVYYFRFLCFPAGLLCLSLASACLCLFRLTSAL